ncbi:MAG: hypothetical protein EOR71_04860 [Mesorhizobium sp.]|nr:MAG: hypothetical protein EOR71_04860 [Mesorhizobium sp.]
MKPPHARRSDHISSVGAAPHCPAEHFSPYSDGEKDAVTDGFANCRRCRMRRQLTSRSGSASRPASRHRHERTAAAWLTGPPCS